MAGLVDSVVPSSCKTRFTYVSLKSSCGWLWPIFIIRNYPILVHSFAWPHPSKPMDHPAYIHLFSSSYYYIYSSFLGRTRWIFSCSAFRNLSSSCPLTICFVLFCFQLKATLAGYTTWVWITWPEIYLIVYTPVYSRYY